MKSRLCDITVTIDVLGIPSRITSHAWLLVKQDNQRKLEHFYFSREIQKYPSDKTPTMFFLAKVDTMENSFFFLLQVASATATFVMMFSSSLSVVEFYLLKRFPIPYGIFSFIFVSYNFRILLTIRKPNNVLFI